MATSSWPRPSAWPSAGCPGARSPSGSSAGFLLGGLAGLAAIALLGLTRKSLLPFGPWLVTGALLGVLAGADVAAWYARTLIGS